MSFQDLEAGTLRPPTVPLPQLVAHGVFQINTKAAALRRLGDALGTPKDTPALRLRLHAAQAEATRLARTTAHNLKRAASAEAATGGASSSRTAPSTKLAMDFEAALKELQQVQQRIAAAERRLNSSSAPAPAAVAAGGALAAGRQQRTGQTQQQQLLAVHGSGTEVHEVIVQERDQGIREVQQVIAEVDEIFRDLVVLVRDQDGSIDQVVCDIEEAAAATSETEQELSTAAAETDRASSSSTNYMLMFVFGLLLFIFLVVLVV